MGKRRSVNAAAQIREGEFILAVLSKKINGEVIDFSAQNPQWGGIVGVLSNQGDLSAELNEIRREISESASVFNSDKILFKENGELKTQAGIRLIDGGTLQSLSGLSGDSLLTASRDDLLKVTSIKLSGQITSSSESPLVAAFCDSADDYNYFAGQISNNPDGEDLSGTLFNAMSQMMEVQEFSLKLFHESPSGGIDGYANITNGSLEIENGKKLALTGKDFQIINTVPFNTETGEPSEPVQDAEILATLLAGLAPISEYSASSIVASDTILNAFGKLQRQIASRATLNSPAFTGTPTAPTAPNGTDTTQIATTAFVQNAVAEAIASYAASQNP